MLRSLVFSVSSVEDFFLDLVIHHLYGCLTTAVEECQQCGHPKRPGLEKDSSDEDMANLYYNERVLKPINETLGFFCTHKMNTFI